LAIAVSLKRFRIIVETNEEEGGGKQMRFVLSLFLVIGSLAGIAICFMSDIVADSSVAAINGMDLSLKFGIFFIAVFLGGVSLLFSRDTL
jgi:hypothetical protein